MGLSFILYALAALVTLRILLNVFGTGLWQFRGPTIAKISDLWRLVEVLRMRQPHTYRKLHEKYGTVVRVGPNSVSVSDPRLVDQVYGHKSDFVKSEMMNPWQTIRNGKIVEGIADTRDRKLHARLKRPIANAYSMTSAASAEVSVDNTIRYFLKRLNEEFVQTKLPCDVDRWVRYYAFDAIAELTFSRRLGFLESGTDINGILEYQNADTNYRAIIGQMPWLDKMLKKNPIYLYFARPSNPFFIHAARVVEDREKGPPLDTLRQDMYSRFLEARKTHPEIVDDEAVARYVFTNLFAGSDTTAIVLRTVVHYTLRNPSVRRRLLDEIDNARLRYPVSFKAAQALPYLDAVIKESLRIHPIAGNSFERVISEQGLPLPDGRKLPGGTIVAMSAWNVHFDPIFGDHVDTFNPDRWLRQTHESEEKWQERVSAMKKANIAFGYGSRICLGRHIAILEIYKLIPTLFGLLDMELAKPEKPWKIEHRFLSKQSEIDVLMLWRHDVDASTLTLMQ